MSNVELRALNQDHDPEDKVVYIAVETRLRLTLTNTSGKALALRSKGVRSALSVHFPPEQFSTGARNGMSAELPGWDFSREGGNLVLTFAGADGTPWASGANLQLTVAQVLSQAQPTPAFYVSVGIIGIDETPKQVKTELVLMNAPVDGNANLHDWVSVTLESSAVLVSRSEFESKRQDALSNTLMLNIKNQGDADLYSGASAWVSGPNVQVTFVYGSTSGALAPDDDVDAPVLGSAWNIKGRPRVTQSGWGAKPKDRTGNVSHPAWELAPDSATNQPILGPRNSDRANVTFAFEPIFSFTPVGHTQMIVLFKGLKQSDTRAYNDAVFVVDIDKRLASRSERGVKLSGPPTQNVTIASKPFDVELSFVLRYVASIRLSCDYSGFTTYSKSYGAGGSPEITESYNARLEGINSSRTVTFTLEAYDGFGELIGSQQHAVRLELQAFVDGDGKPYSVLTVGNLVWMVQNLDRASGVQIKGHESEEATFGRLYTGAQARALQPPHGWRLPSLEEWQQLVAKFGPDPAKAFTALRADGTSHFEAQLGGRSDNLGSFSSFGERGYYWTSAPGRDSGTTHCVVFSGASKTVAVVENTMPDTWTASVRFVRDG